VILDGIRVLSFTTGIAGPNAGRILASLGAEVIKVESRSGGVDAFRYFGTGDDLNSSARFAEANLGVRSVAVNLKDPDGLDVVRRLAATCDVVLENFRPGVLDRLGLGYERLREDRPDIVVVTMPGLGSTGPMRDFGTWGALLTAYTGLTWGWNHPESVVPIGNQGVFPDYLTAVLAPMVVVSALLARERTGEGCLIDLAQSEATAFCALPVSMLEVSVLGVDPPPIGNRSRDGALQGVYRCLGDDRWCAVRIETEPQLRAVIALIDGAATADPRFATVADAVEAHDEFDAALEAWTTQRDAPEVMATLQGLGVAAGLVASGTDLVNDTQLTRAGFIRRLDQPGVGRLTIPGLPIETYPPLVEEPGPAAALGEDTYAILTGDLGIAEEEYQRLETAGVLR
jgi:crotonobetainyl-CoA:carnitine CoA-transferase CaiB-like acyl-CoA transferase